MKTQTPEQMKQAFIDGIYNGNAERAEKCRLYLMVRIENYLKDENDFPTDVEIIKDIALDPFFNNDIERGMAAFKTAEIISRYMMELNNPLHMLKRLLEK